MTTSCASNHCVAIHDRTRGVPLWISLPLIAIVFASAVVTVLIFSGRSLFHPFDSPDERIVREYFERQFTPFEIIEIKKPEETRWLVTLHRPALFRVGMEAWKYNLWLKNGTAIRHSKL